MVQRVHNTDNSTSAPGQARRASARARARSADFCPRLRDWVAMSLATSSATSSALPAAPSTSSDPALDALLQQLTPEARQAYWHALGRFLRFETSKAEFEESVTGALGSRERFALHNAFVCALLRAALGEDDAVVVGPSVSTEEATSMQVDVPAAAATAAAAAGTDAAQRLHAPPPTGGAGVLQPTADPTSEGAPGVAAPSTPSAAGGGGGLKLSLKIKMGSDGNLAAVSEPMAEMTIDPAEEAQLNALHERLTETAKQCGVSRVAPEATAFMQRALVAHVHRLIAARVHNPSAGHHAQAGWMWPPSQRVPVGTQDFSECGPSL